MFGFRKGLVASAVVAASICTGASTSFAASSWEFSEDSVNLGINAVSPHVERTNGYDRVWFPSLPSTAVVDCNDAGSCTSVAGVGRFGF